MTFVIPIKNEDSYLNGLDYSKLLQSWETRVKVMRLKSCYQLVDSMTLMLLSGLILWLSQYQSD